MLYKSRLLRNSAPPLQSIKFVEGNLKELYKDESKSQYFEITPSNADVSKISFELDNDYIEVDGITPTEIEGRYKLDFHGVKDSQIVNPTVYDFPTKLTTTVIASKKSISATFYVRVLPRGTKWQNSDTMIREFVYLGNNKDGTGIATLLDYNGGYANYFEVDELQAQWRTYYENEQLNKRYSKNILDAMQSVDKVSIATVSDSAITTQIVNSKYHLASTNEFGVDATGINMPNLGSITYNVSYNLLQNKLSLNAFLFRSKGYNNNIKKAKIYYNQYSKSLSYQAYNLLDETQMIICPLIFLLSDTRVIFIETYYGTRYYRIDWTGTSSTRLSNLTVGDIVRDWDGSWV